MPTQERESYHTPEFDQPIRLRLNFNESCCVLKDPSHDLARLSPDDVTRYPSLDALTNLIAKQLLLPAERIVITAGGDQAIERVVRTSISGDRATVLVHAPSFKMIEIYTANSHGRLQQVEWTHGAFPVDEFTNQINDQTALVVVVTPNNPTGQTVSIDVLKKIAESSASQGVKFLVDLAYVEFADVDPTTALADIDNVIMVRTFSKAYGLAGLRVGYLIAPTAELAQLYRDESGPFPVAGPSLSLAATAYQQRSRKDEIVSIVRAAREKLIQLIGDCGGRPFSSQGNFVLAEFAGAEKIWQKLADQGVAVRKFPGAPFMENKLRFTCPTNPADDLHLAKALIRATESEISADKLSVLQTGENELAVESPVEQDQHVRHAEISRATKETDIRIELNLDGTGKTQIETGIGFLDHMLTALGFHARFDLKLICEGDLHIDDHHTAEDCALALGSAIDQALGERKGIVRFGYAYAPLDEALARSVIDLSGRPWPEVHLSLEREMVGTIATENITHVFNSLAMALRCSLHVDVIRGTNDHHRAEAAFKSLALALRKAVSRTAGEVPSTKGVL